MSSLSPFMLSMVLAASIATPVCAAPAPSTRLVDCRPESCLLISGNRADPASTVHVNGHALPVEGGRKWRVRLPVSSIRAWSAPLARTITISAGETIDEADLPIGLLGHSSDLAMLVVRAK